MLRTSFLVLCVFASVASAQSSGLSSAYPVERLRFTPDRSSLVDVEFGRVIEHLDFDIGLMLGGANDPLVVYKTSTRERVGTIVTDRVSASVVGTIGLFDWVQIGVEIPVVLFQAGQRDIPNVTVETLPQLATTGLGDIRFLPKIRLLKSEDFGIDLAILASVYVPTGGGANYFGDSSVLITPEIALSRAFGQFRVAGNISLSLLRDPVQVANLGIGNELTFRLGAGYRFFDESKNENSGFELDGSLTSSTSLANLYRDANQQALEFKAQGSYHFNRSLLAFLGGGVGILPGWGTPDWRAFAGVRFGHFGASKPVAVARLDTDGDGIFDDLDKCQQTAEDKDGFEDGDGCADPDNDADGVLDVNDKCVNLKGVKENLGCPDVDTDGDGLVDRLDKCPKQAEDKDTFEDDDGCPDADNDSDSVLDVDDTCPLVKGVVEMKGCPDVDTDSDTVVDRLDNCPKEPGTVPNKGCKAKQLVVLNGNKLEILDSVYFKLNKAIIETRSYPLLNNVAAILDGHPELKVVRVEGHTDSQGNDSSNLKLSDGRAKAVVAYLIKKGIAKERLTGKGFGETKPIADNATKPGRAMNRRVEFNLGEDSGIGKSNNGAGTDTLEK